MTLVGKYTIKQGVHIRNVKFLNRSTLQQLCFTIKEISRNISRNDKICEVPRYL